MAVAGAVLSTLLALGGALAVSRVEGGERDVTSVASPTSHEPSEGPRRANEAAHANTSRPERQANGDAVPQGRIEEHVPYEITPGGTRVTINLAGGPSRVSSFATPDGSHATVVDATPADLARLRARQVAPSGEASGELLGKVVDDSGNPVEGALVLAGARIAIDRAHPLEPHASADTGGRTDPRGRFELEVDEATGVYAMALTRECASSLTPWTGEGDLELVLRCGTRVSGTLTRGGEGTSGTVRLTSEDDALSISARAGIDGDFAVHAAPPGTFVASASISDGFEDPRGPTAEVSMAIVAGTTTTIALELQPGTLVALSLRLDGSRPASAFVTHALIDGTHDITSADAIEVLDQELGEQAVRVHVSGGTDMPEGTIERVVQFEDVAPGSYTICGAIEPIGEDTIDAVVACEGLTIESSDEVRELELAIGS